MGRPPKKGLDYFFKDTDFYDDDKIIDLLEQEGPIGLTVYDVLLCMIYKNGYYIEFTDLDHLALKVVRTIGNRWVKKGTAKRVLHTCADIGLFDKPLLLQGVITSTGLQQRYDQVTVRSRASKDKYWLLDRKDPEQPLLKEPSKIVIAEETRVFAEETPVNAANSATKKRREENIYIYFANPELNGIFLRYLQMRREHGSLSDDQADALKDQLNSMSNNDDEKMAIVRQALASGWKGFYPLRKSDQPKRSYSKKNSFNNFTQRSYDFGALEKKLITKEDNS